MADWDNDPERVEFARNKIIPLAKQDFHKAVRLLVKEDGGMSQFASRDEAEAAVIRLMVDSGMSKDEIRKTISEQSSESRLSDNPKYYIKPNRY
jgi:hypothetical protein